MLALLRCDMEFSSPTMHAPINALVQWKVRAVRLFGQEQALIAAAELGQADIRTSARDECGLAAVVGQEEPLGFPALAVLADLRGPGRHDRSEGPPSGTSLPAKPRRSEPRG